MKCTIDAFNESGFPPFNSLQCGQRKYPLKNKENQQKLTNCKIENIER